MRRYQNIVIGSGCSGAIAAQTLVESGAEVLMIDGGIQKPKFDIPDKSFLELRKKDKRQSDYFMGRAAEGVSWGGVDKGAQVTPPRQYMADLVKDYLPVESKNFSPLESLGYGGLGIGWGLQSWEYSETDLLRAGLDTKNMREAYEVVSKRIGISGTRDEAAAYTLGNLGSFQPSPKLDRNGANIYRRYQSKKPWFEANNLILGRTPLALLTKSLGNRQAYTYHDMDFYSDAGLSAWRPWITINQLKRRKNFEYEGGWVVRRLEEKRGYVLIHCQEIQTGKAAVFSANNVILAAGALGSARIVLRSFGSSNSRLPLLCNPYVYFPCLQTRFLGKGTEARKIGFAQLSLFLDETRDQADVSVASIYSYQSLMSFRIVNQLPMNFKDGRELMRYLLPSLIILGVHHPDSASKRKYLRLIGSGTDEKLQISYTLDKDEVNRQREREKKFVKAMRKLGVHAIKRVDPGYGSSVHYAGTIPFSDQSKPLTLSRNGKLHGTKRIFIADSSGFTHLPARGLTFSLMANAHLVAEGVLRHAG